MRVLLLTANHRTAPLELRERLAIAPERMPEAIEFFRTRFPRSEIVLLSTCNRTEIYLARPAHEAPHHPELRSALAEFCSLPEPALQAAIITLDGEPAITHLLRVACGIDSMVVGEPQILGQVKRAYELASQNQSVGPVLHKLFQHAIATAKSIRHQTGIGDGRLSIGSVAVDFARQIFERFDDKTVVCIGAGQMAKLTLKHLLDLRPAKLWIANRSLPRADALAQNLELQQSGITGGVRDLNALDQLLIEADIVLTSTGASHPVLTAARLKPLLKPRRYRPLFVIDIAVPRDVEPAVGDLSDVYLYNIDDLQSVVEQTRQQRGQQINHCQTLLEQATRVAMAQLQHRDVGQVIRQLRHKLHELGDVEQQRTLRKIAANLPPDQAQLVEELLAEHTHRLINKMLHLPLSQLDHRQADSSVAVYAAALRRLFNLPDEGASDASSPSHASDSAPGKPTQKSQT